MNIGERIQKIRGELSREKFAAITEISKNTLVNYEKCDSSPTSEYLNRLLKLYPEINPGWLLTGEGLIERDKSPIVLGGGGEDLKEDYYLIPRYDVHADCGGGAVVENECIVEFLAFSKRWVNAHHQPADLFLLTAQGDSMNPTIHEGDILLVDKARKRVTEDGIYILGIDHELVAKRLQRLFDGSVRIVSDNKAYSEQMVPSEQLNRLEIIGRVVWKGGRI